jgi:hypothetical protein
VSLGLLVGLALQVGSATPAIIDRARLDPRKDVDFHALALPETVFVGQAATYELGVFISDDMRRRLRKNPEFVPPELQSVLAYDLREPSGARTIVRDGRTYEVHVFRRALFPVAPGRIAIPAARLTYEVPLGSSFFSREETRLLTAEPVTIVAIPPPTAGRPAKWGGAVGDLRVSVIANGARIRVGDPFVVTLRVAGEANVHLLPRPEWSVPWGTIVPGEERVVIDSLAPAVHGSKEFDWLVTPTVEGRVSLPAISYPYFNPALREYRVASSAAQVLLVNPGGLANIDTLASPVAVTHPLALRPAWSRPWPDAPDSALWYWLVFGLAPLPVLVKLARTRPRIRDAGSAAGALHLLVRDGNADTAHLRAALRHALDARFDGAPISWADASLVRKSLRHHGVTDRTIDDAMVLFARLDGVAYGGSGEPVADAAARAVATYDAIDREARAGRKRRATAHTAALLSLILVAALGAQTGAAGASPRALFDHGVSEYATGSTASAATSFLRAARAAPAAAAAWVNAGTASWTVGDTAVAVAAWQHALRLDPYDTDVRTRLVLIGADAGAGRNVVWPVPRRAPAWLALLLWVAGWGALWRGRRRRIAAGAVVMAALLAGLSRVQHRRLADPSVAVVAVPAALRALPALVAEAGATPLTGELVKVMERSGVWVRVVASDGREGWIDAGRLIDLDARPLRD